MAFCAQCGKQLDSQSQFCPACGKSVGGTGSAIQPNGSTDNNNLARFLLTFFLGFIGSIVINHSSLRREGWKSRSWAYFWLGIITFGIYTLVASICNLTFNASNPTNIGYFKYDGYISK